MYIVLLRSNKVTQTSSVVMEKAYEDTQWLQNNTSLEVINNYNKNLDNIFTQLQADLITVLKTAG